MSRKEYMNNYEKLRRNNYRKPKNYQQLSIRMYTLNQQNLIGLTVCKLKDSLNNKFGSLFSARDLTQIQCLTSYLTILEIYLILPTLHYYILHM